MEQPDKIKQRDGNLQRNLLFLAALGCLVTWLLSAGGTAKQHDYAREKADFERVLHKKEQFLKEEISRLEIEFEKDDPLEVLGRRSSQYQKLSVRKDIAIFFYDGRELKYWSDHAIPIHERWSPRLNKPFLSLRNADYVTVTSQQGEKTLLGLIEVRKHYPFQNEFLINGFQKDFNLDPEVTIEFLEEEGCLPVLNREGEYLFSLDFKMVQQDKQEPGQVTRIAFIGFLIFFWAALFIMADRAAGTRRWLWVAVTALLIPSGTLLFLHFGIASLFENVTLFQPDIFANRLFASLGHLLVISVSVLALVALFYRQRTVAKKGNRISCRVLSIMIFLVGALMFLLVELLLRSLVLDSMISLEPQRVITLSTFSFVALAVIMMWFASIGMVMDRAITCANTKTWRVALYGIGAISVTFLLAYLLPWENGSWSGWAGLTLIFLGQLFIRHGHPDRIPFSRYIFLLFFVSFFLVIRFQEYNRIKVDRQKEVELVKLSTEHDPVAEMLFSDISQAIRNDSLLARYMDPFIEIEPLVGHLNRNYFSGYLTKYELQFTVCRPGDRVYLAPPDDEWYHCYTFFEEMIQTKGIEVPGSDFYFLDNLNGRISYLAVIPYLLAGEEHRIFIELDSRIISEELGYPELLLDERYSDLTNLDFSYARYNKGILITRNGDFSYRRLSAFYTSGEETFERVTMGGWDHKIYNVDKDNTIIVGSPSVTLVDNLISFSYIFALNFLMLAMIFLLVDAGKKKPGFDWSFKNRIQYSMVGTLFLTFVLICSGTIYFIVQQYRDKNNDSLRNTMRSVYIELIHKVEYEKDLSNWSSDSYYNLDELLRKFSNVFYTDINLYDQNGELLATSRGEIFESQLLSMKMNRLVYEELSGGRASEIIHQEHIGELNYISAYVPLLNGENQFLAYLNLPYFTQSGALTRDVTNMVVAVINIYLILLLVILGLSVFLADRITQPLRMLQSRIARISLNAKNETIVYHRSDEIRGLVEEYNYMVQELEKSAGLLAQSERESAWREMAKQIAHEIKNPLTPMKLNVQHLQRAIGEGVADPAMVERISSTLVEQIDSLSAIANEFSDFAKMPKTKSSRLELVSKLHNLLQLFEATERTEMILDTGPQREVYVFADKEQLMRVFINLVKNGLQSIPRNRKGIIRIGLAVDELKAVVSITDNGNGIPEDIRDKLFQPNFTTKSGGMGMGLAISSSIVRSLGGKIWYDTVHGKGTTFYVSLPLMVEKTEQAG